MFDIKKSKKQLIKELNELRKQIHVLKNSSENETVQDNPDSEQPKESLQHFVTNNRDLIENSPICTKVVDLDFNLQFMSSSGIKALLIDDITEYYGTPFPLSFYPDSFGLPMLKILQNVKETGETIVHEGFIYDLKGNEIWLHNTILPVYDDHGKLDYIMIISRAINEQKKYEKKLIESEEENRLLINNSPYCILQTELNGKIFSMNKAGQRMLDVQNEQEVIGVDYLSFVSEKDRSRLTLLLQNAINGTSSEFEFIAINNKELSSSFIPIKNESGVVIRLMVISRDITETKRLQELESRSEQLETAGTIAGQVAHDFNNLLAPLMAYPEFIRDELPKNHPTLKYLYKIEKAAHQIAEINQDLLAMGRRGHYNLETLNLNKVINHALDGEEPIADTIICEKDLSPDLRDIRGGSAQLHRMISNIIHNAIDSMQDIGQLTVKTENYYLEDDSILYGSVPIGQYVKLTISDTGCGISDDNIQKIFDPFFTSKTADKKRGSGLGMSVVDSVVKDHNGYIDFSTKVGEGTSFYIYLPITSDSKEQDNLIGVVGGNESILIVDDDEVQREVSGHILTSLGYNINYVDSGEEALLALQKKPQDLVILDMVMPGGIDGAETFRQILEFNQSQKAIIVSGFSESARVHVARQLGVGAFVKKPFTKSTISSVVRAELDRKEKILV